MSIPHADDPLGYDVKIGSDLDPSGRPSWGAELVADALLHRLQADTLLMTEAPSGEIDFGIDLARKLAGGARSPGSSPPGNRFPGVQKSVDI